MRECEVWSRVLELVMSELQTCGRPEDVIYWKRRALRVRNTWRLLRPGFEPSPFKTSYRSYLELMSGLYREVASATGTRVIVDSSKRPSDAAVLPRLAGVTPYVVHLVRDPRAVAYSWRRPKLETDRADPREMEVHGPTESSMYWLVWNLAADAVRQAYGPTASMLVRYEDFIGAPGSVLSSITEMVGEATGLLPFIEGRLAQIGTTHTVSGNPDRFRTGLVELKRDDEWRTHQPTADRILSTLPALPLLHRYGYPVTIRDRGSPSDSHAPR